MIMERLSYFWSYYRAELVICVLGIAMLAWLATLFWLISSDHQRLMEQCLADGRKRYECAGILSGANSSPVIAPVIIPMPLPGR